MKSTPPDAFSPRSARLESALEDRLQNNTPPDLTASILGAASLPRRPRDRSGWLVAALVLLGLSIIPAIHWLQREAEQSSTSAPLPDDADFQDPLQDGPELVTPESVEALLTLLEDARGLSARVLAVRGLPLQSAGEPEIPFVPLYGEGARRDLGWATTSPDGDGDALELLVAGMRRMGPINDSNHRARTLEVRIALPGNRAIPLTVALPGGTIQDDLPPGDSLPALFGRSYPSQSVWIEWGTHRLAVEDSEALRVAWATVDMLTSRTLRQDRGAYWGSELERESVHAKRAARLRLHDATPAQLAVLGGSSNCELIDLRASPALASPEGMAELAHFPKLRTLILGAGAVGDALGDGPLPSVEELIFCDESEDPRGTPTLPTASTLKAGDDGPLFRAFPNLRVLVAPGLRAQDSDLEALSDSIEQVSLRFPAGDNEDDRARVFTERGLVALAKLPRLASLDLGYCRSWLSGRGTDPGLNVVRELATAERLVSLNLDGWFDRRARDVEADDAERRKVALAEIATMLRLRRLSLRDNGDIVGSDALALQSGDRLKQLDLRGCWRLPRQSIVQLEQALPLCAILPTSDQRKVAMRFLAHAGYDRGGVSFDLKAESDRLKAWWAGLDPQIHNRTSFDARVLEDFHRRTPKQGGPLAGANLRWVVHRVTRRHPENMERGGYMFSRNYDHVVILGFRPSVLAAEEAPTVMFELVPINMHEKALEAGDFARAFESIDHQSGGPALSYELVPDKIATYAEVTERYLKKTALAILIGDELLMAPAIETPIREGKGQIRGLTRRLIEELAILLNER